MAFTIKQIESYLTEKGWQFIEHQNKNQLILRMKMKTVDTCSIQMSVVSPSTAIFYTIFPIKVPENRRAAVNEYLTRANGHLTCGNFQMRYDDGEVRFRLGQFSETAEEVPQSHLEQLINLGCHITDIYAPGLLSVLYAEEDPAAALRRCQANR